MPGRTCHRSRTLRWTATPVVAADTAGASPGSPVRLPVVAEVAAGTRRTERSRPGRRCGSSPGRRCPPGPTAVVMVERTERLDGGAAVALLAEVARRAPRATRRRRPAPATSSSPPARCSPPGTSACSPASVRWRCRCTRAASACCPPGDELIPPGQPLGPGQIHDSNRLTLLALVPEAGGEPVDLGLIPDDADAIRAAILGRGPAATSCSPAAGCRWATSTS